MIRDMFAQIGQASGSDSWMSGWVLLAIAIVVLFVMPVIVVLGVFFGDLLAKIGGIIIALVITLLSPIAVFVLLYNFYNILRKHDLV
jgi:CBS domain containing-hemolysin-like protein